MKLCVVVEEVVVETEAAAAAAAVVSLADASGVPRRAPSGRLSHGGCSAVVAEGGPERMRNESKAQLLVVFSVRSLVSEHENNNKKRWNRLVATIQEPSVQSWAGTRRVSKPEKLSMRLTLRPLGDPCARLLQNAD